MITGSCSRTARRTARVERFDSAVSPAIPGAAGPASLTSASPCGGWNCFRRQSSARIAALLSPRSRLPAVDASGSESSDEAAPAGLDQHRSCRQASGWTVLRAACASPCCQSAARGLRRHCWWRWRCRWRSGRNGATGPILKSPWRRCSLLRARPLPSGQPAPCRVQTDRWVCRILQSAPDRIRALLPGVVAGSVGLGLDPAEPGDRLHRDCFSSRRLHRRRSLAAVRRCSGRS